MLLDWFKRKCKHETIYYTLDYGICKHGKVITKMYGKCRLCNVITHPVHYYDGNLNFYEPDEHDYDCANHVRKLIELGCQAK